MTPADAASRVAPPSASRRHEEQRRSGSRSRRAARSARRRSTRNGSTRRARPPRNTSQKLGERAPQVVRGSLRDRRELQTRGRAAHVRSVERRPRPPSLRRLPRCSSSSSSVDQRRRLPSSECARRISSHDATRGAPRSKSCPHHVQCAVDDRPRRCCSRSSAISSSRAALAVLPAASSPAPSVNVRVMIRPKRSSEQTRPLGLEKSLGDG